MTPQTQVAPLTMLPITWLAGVTSADRLATEREWPQKPGGIQLLPCGVHWDVIRLPQELGLAALQTLLASDAAPAVGPVMHDPLGSSVYWLVSMQVHADWTWARAVPVSRVLSTGDYLPAVEPPPATRGRARWVHWPRVTGALTPPGLLAAAIVRELPGAAQ